MMDTWKGTKRKKTLGRKNTPIKFVPGKERLEGGGE